MGTPVDDICVIISAFDSAPTIARAVTSALAQPEVSSVVVVDDASRDATAAAARAGDDGSGRLQVVRFDANRGPSAARNAAIAASTSRFIAILDADDYFTVARFAGLPDDGWDLLADNIAFVLESGAGPVDPAHFPHDNARRRLGFDEFIERNISHPGRPRSELGFLKPVIRRSALARLELRYDEDLRLGEDFILYATALARGARFDLRHHVGYVAVVRAGSLSGRHGSADLAALARADRRLAVELAQRNAAPAWRALLADHLNALDRKVATRRYIDHKHEVGLLRATLGLLRTPTQFWRAAVEIVDGKLRRRLPGTPPALRMLFDPGEFAASPQDR